MREGKVEEAKKLNIIGYNKAYSIGQREAINNEIDYVANYCSNLNNVILDIASGTGRLAIEVVKKVKSSLILSDVSFNVMKKTYVEFNKLGYSDKITCMAFDASAIPFKKKSIKTIITYVGLQNILNIEGTIRELKRICSGEFLSICSFIPKEDITNKKALKNNSTLWLNELYIKQFSKHNWKLKKENSNIVNVRPTPIGKIAKGFGIDGFPVAETQFEYCIYFNS